MVTKASERTAPKRRSDGWRLEIMKALPPLTRLARREEKNLPRH